MYAKTTTATTNIGKENGNEDMSGLLALPIRGARDHGTSTQSSGPDRNRSWFTISVITATGSQDGANIQNPAYLAISRLITRYFRPGPECCPYHVRLTGVPRPCDRNTAMPAHRTIKLTGTGTAMELAFP